jgi:ribosomal protein S18 acetylase RimI-like enzyme
VAPDLDADPHADWPDRTPLLGDDGRTLLVFSQGSSTRSGRPWADGAWRPGDVDVDECLEAVLEAFAGYAFSTSDVALAGALLKVGATTLRHAHSMSHSLAQLPPLEATPAMRIEPLPSRSVLEHAEELGRINFRAYSPGHPDHEHETVEAAVREMRGIALGHILGPYLDVSQVATVDEALAGACLVVDRDGAPPEGGPWVVDVFRDPAANVRGIGKAMLIHTLHSSRAAGLPALSLAVSHENANAMQLYTELGFADAGESLTLAIP